MERQGDPDQQLAQAALSGDRDAFGELVQRHQRLVAGVAWRYGTPRDEVEDVVSEVFIKVFERLHQYRPSHPFSTWLYRVAANHVMDRGRSRRREVADEDPAASAAPVEAVAPSRLEERERAEMLREAVGELAPIYRRPLFLVYVEGHRVGDAARLLGLPVGTVKVRLMRARRQLGDLLRQRYPGYFEEIADAV